MIDNVDIVSRMVTQLLHSSDGKMHSYLTKNGEPEPQKRRASSSLFGREFHTPPQREFYSVCKSYSRSFGQYFTVLNSYSWISSILTFRLFVHSLSMRSLRGAPMLHATQWPNFSHGQFFLLSLFFSMLYKSLRFQCWPHSRASHSHVLSLR